MPSIAVAVSVTEDPNGYHRHFTGSSATPHLEVQVHYDVAEGKVVLHLSNSGNAAADYIVTANAYFDESPWVGTVAANSQAALNWSLHSSSHWYDFTLTIKNLPGYSRRFAGHMETGSPSISDPALGGVAISDQEHIA